MMNMNRRTAICTGGAFAGGAMAIGLPFTNDFAKGGIAGVKKYPWIISHSGVIDGMLKVSDLSPKLRMENVHVFVPDDSFHGYRRMKVSNFENKTLTTAIKSTIKDDTIFQISIELMHSDHAKERLGIMFTRRNSPFMHRGMTRMHMGEAIDPNGVTHHAICMYPLARNEAEINRTAKIFGAFVHQAYGKTEPEWTRWIPDWVNGGEYRSDFATRIIADGGKSTEMIDRRTIIA